jgi:hypothetical protein
MNDTSLPDVVAPGSVWCWEPLKPELRCRVKVVSAEWSGLEWYVEIRALEAAGHMWLGMRQWHHLDRFIACCALDDPSVEV